MWLYVKKSALLTGVLTLVYVLVRGDTEWIIVLLCEAPVAYLSRTYENHEFAERNLFRPDCRLPDWLEQLRFHRWRPRSARSRCAGVILRQGDGLPKRGG